MTATISAARIYIPILACDGKEPKSILSCTLHKDILSIPEEALKTRLYSSSLSSGFLASMYPLTISLAINAYAYWIKQNTIMR